MAAPAPFVDVAVNSGLPHRGAFSYAVPEGMALAPGDAVFVPFGRRTLQGIVVEATEVPAVAGPRPVEAKLDDLPVVSPERIALARWVSDYYLSPLFPAVALMLPPGFERKPLTFYESLLEPEELDRITLPPRQRAVLSLLARSGRLEAAQVEKLAGLSGVAAALSQLVQRGLVRRTYGLARPTVRRKTARYVELCVQPAEALAAAERLEAARKRRLAAALRLLAQDIGLPAPHLRARTGAGERDLAPLVEAGLVAVRERQVERDPLAGRAFEHRPPPLLTPEQERAFAPIAAALDSARNETFLLHGITGSGKTEVYLKALERCLAGGRRGIVLVPEIALTPQTIRRFAERFPGQVAVMHSGLSAGEAFDQWHGIRGGRYGVVIGSRSALFAPQPDLGLVVIDEEHEWTYKQHDQSPRYHARETAEKLCELTGAVLILGSATPDVVSYQRALWRQYTLLELRERVRPVLDAAGEVVRISASQAMPPVEVVDMREELRTGNRSIFSRPLQLGLYQVLERGEQAILFLNRRGTAGFVQCRDCGYVPQCPSCAIALSLHAGASRPSLAEDEADGVSRGRHPGARAGDILLCHQCNRARRAFERCPMCGGVRLRPMGLGVERVEEEVAALFPQARVLRWDRDVTRGRNAHEKILARFLEGKADILIGTQMVAKGLDLPSVTLVGVISADIGLHIPDFRSGERTFQLLTQVAGRAGRALAADGGPPAGEVVVQTYTPDNYAIVAAARQDYAEFFATESEIRHESGYPPFTRLARLVHIDGNHDRGLRNAERMARGLRQEASRRGLPGVEVLGPAPPYVPKWHGRYRWQVTVRAADPAELLAPFKLPANWTLDIDPVSLA
ncbi:MAG TPA: primosomal protein N' [Dehalococcoidia bacterium]|nr:primosomal protein N' [Dehalococcoidia bacterium]